MDRSNKGLHFQASNSPKSSSTQKPSLSGENNENDIKQDQMDSKSQNLKKPFHKHFMSPTVSATSKATVPRKKILAEKNESTASLDDHFPTLESRSGLLHHGTAIRARSSSGSFPANNSACQFDDDEQNTSYADSSLKPYDPFTNYLSPRPQYLRYKPNRRREILDRQQCLDEKEDGLFLERSSSFESKYIVDEVKSLDCVQDSLIPPLHEGTATLKNQESVRPGKDNGDDDDAEEEEEIEEFEEEKRCSLKGALKYLFLLVVIGLSTSYISSMNSPRPSPMQSTGGFQDGHYRMLNHSLEAIPTNLHGGDGGMQCTQTREAQAGFSGENQPSSYQEYGKFQMVLDDEGVLMESGDGIVRAFESLNAQNLYIYVTGFDKSDTIFDHHLNVNTAGSEDVDSDPVDLNTPHWDIAEIVILNGKMDNADDSSDHSPGVEGAKTDASTDHELNMVEQNSQGLQVQETTKKFDSLGDHKGCSRSASGNDEVVELENNLEAVEGIFMENAVEELEDNGEEKAAGVSGTMEDEEAHYMVEKVKGISAEEAGEKMVEARSKRPKVKNDESSESSLMDYNNYEGPDDSMFEAGLKLMKARFIEFGPIHTACVGISVFAILLASLVYIYPVREIRAPSRASQPVKAHIEESNRKEKVIQVQPNVDIECLQKKVESTSVKPSTMFFSTEETRKELSYNQAPKVELLGELMIGKVSSSIRSCGRENKIIETEQSVKVISHEESRAHSASQAQPSSVLDTGSSDSPSYGTFTAEKKIQKKQGAGDGRVKMVTTPVRRSSRLQNRSVTSP